MYELTKTPSNNNTQVVYQVSNYCMYEGRGEGK